MFGTSKHGFTLIEILVVIALIGVMATIALPNLMPRQPGQERKLFVTKLNELMRFSWQQAILSGKIQRVVINVAQRTIALQEAESFDKQGEPVFTDMDNSYLQTSLTWPEQLEVRNLYIEGFDEMSRSVGRQTEKVWFYLVPNGLTQRVTINMLDNDDIRDGKVVRMALVLNPYTAQFSVYDEFKQ
jgi:prepilin-type N-terminal cleavage/methylation domain-containing protein